MLAFHHCDRIPEQIIYNEKRFILAFVSIHGILNFHLGPVVPQSFMSGTCGRFKATHFPARKQRLGGGSGVPLCPSKSTAPMI